MKFYRLICFYKMAVRIWTIPYEGSPFSPDFTLSLQMQLRLIKNEGEMERFEVEFLK